MSAPARLRTGLVGAGLVGQAGHAISLFEEQDRFEFAVVVDASATVREAVAARYHVPAARGSLEEALELGLDAVVVAVPDAAHCETVLAALRGGLHVFCEKPLTISLAECDAIIAARGDRVVQCGYMKLYDPAVERMVELLRAGDPEPVYLSVEVNDPDQAPFVDHLGLVIGRDVPLALVEDLRARQARAVADALGVEPDAEQARAFEAFFGALVHDVSLAHHLLEATGVHPPLPMTSAGYFDAGRGVSLTWALPGGGRAHLTHLNLPGVADYRERVTVYGRDRILELTFPSPYLRHQPTRLVERRSDGTTGLLQTEYRVSYEEAFRNELRAFHAAITTGVPVRASVEGARDDIAALLDAVRLAAERQPLSLGEFLMRIGLFTDGLAHLPRREAFAWCSKHDITDLEMSVGPWGSRTHLDLPALLADDSSARDDLRRDLDDHGLRLSAVNAAGNPLHPDPAGRHQAQAALRGAIELAARLGVDRVVTMAGCPGGRTGGPIGVFGLWATSNDDEGIWAWQMEAEVGPYWRELSAWAAATAPDVVICLELHPGVSVYNVETYKALRTYAGPNVGVNLDPSHFWWQGADPVRVIEALGPVIGWCHGKDTTVYPDRVALHGVLDHRFPPDAAVNTWHFSAIGDGHDAATWTRLIRALQAAGHDSVVSIEHEDPSLTPEESIERAASTLVEILG